MTNPFLLSAIEDQQAAPTNANPFALPVIQADQRQDLRNTLRAAVQENPDNAAEAERLAKRYPAPNEVLLRNLKNVQLQEAVDNGGAQARCLHDDEFEGVTLSDGSRHPLPF